MGEVGLPNKRDESIDVTPNNHCPILVSAPGCFIKYTWNWNMRRALLNTILAFTLLYAWPIHAFAQTSTIDSSYFAYPVGLKKNVTGVDGNKIKGYPGVYFFKHVNIGGKLGLCGGSLGFSGGQLRRVLKIGRLMLNDIPVIKNLRFISNVGPKKSHRSTMYAYQLPNGRFSIGTLHPVSAKVVLGKKVGCKASKVAWDPKFSKIRPAVAIPDAYSFRS
jgi:hypothetical protein